MTRSQQGLQHEGTEADFWATLPNPMQIERGQAEAISLARAATRQLDTGTRRQADHVDVQMDRMESRRLTAVIPGIPEEQPPAEHPIGDTPSGGNPSFSMGDISSELSTTRVNWHPAHNTPAQREETQVLSTMEHEDRRERSPTWVMEYQEVASHYMTGVPTEVDTPDILKDCLLILAHDNSGHNGFRRTYGSFKNRYYWKGMKKSVHQHCTNCQVCAKHNIKTQQLRNEHFSSPPQPVEFIAMDLIAEFHPASNKGTRH